MKTILVSLLLFTFSFNLQAAVVGKQVKYKIGNQQYTGYLAYDNKIKGKRPGVLVVHEWWGHDAYARKRARMLARLGYTAFALDMYGSGKLAKHPKDANAMMTAVFSNIDGMKQRFRKGKQILMAHKTVDKNRIAAIGYCMGGGISLAMGRGGEDLNGIIVLHGSLGTKVPVKKGVMKAEVLVLTGGADPNIPKTQVDAFKKEMDAAGVKYQVVSYPGVKHSFSNPAATAIGRKYKIPLAYNKNADQDSWKRIKVFLKRIFK